MAFTSEPLEGNHSFGAVIRNLDPADLGRTEVRRALVDLWIDKGVLVFRGMPGGRETHVKLSRVFGDLELHPVVESRRQDYPEIITLNYNPVDGDLYAVDGDERGGFLPWHSDLVYVDRINRGGILRPTRIPARGGQTGFIDQISAYAALPDDLKARIEGLYVVYLANYDISAKKFGVRPEARRYSEIMLRVQKTLHKFSRVLHPMVFTQNETGRKVLNVSPWFALGIENMENAEGDALLAQVIAHCEDETRAYYHDWQPDDMVLWDNWRMLHSAYGVPKDETRSVERTTIKGDYALGRIAKGGGAFTEEQRISI